jgi:hypothetical protein
MSASSSLATFAADEASAEEWFALDRGMQAKVHSVVAGQSTELDLSHSNFTHIPGGVVATWTALTTLNLYNCSSLVALPESICELQVLTTLDLGYCSSLVALPESIGQLRALTTLDLYNCSSLAALPDSIGQLRALTMLHLMSSCKSLRVLPESMGQLRALTTLDLGGCSSLAALPESIGQLRALTTLDLYACYRLDSESREGASLLVRRNEQIRQGRALRFPMTTHTFAATILFGSMIRARPSSAAGGGRVEANAAGEVVAGAKGGRAPPPLRRVLGAFPNCILSKLNGDGPVFASMFKRCIADYCGLSYEAAFAEWAAEIEWDLSYSLLQSKV